MSFRSWVLVAAFGLVAVSLQAQEQTDSAPSYTGEQENKSEDNSFGIPIRIIEDPISSEARNRREAEAEQREKDDLIAQQGMNAATQAMNEATQSMKFAAWWSFGVVTIGTALLIWTLILTRAANRAARDAVDVTMRIGEAQVRAYLSVSHVDVTVYPQDHGTVAWYYVIDLTNSGQSPAQGVFMTVEDKVSKGTKQTHVIDAVQAGKCSTEEIMISTDAEMLSFTDGGETKAIVSVIISLSYVDVFGKRHDDWSQLYTGKIYLGDGERVPLKPVPVSVHQVRLNQDGN